MRKIKNRKTTSGWQTRKNTLSVLRVASSAKNADSRLASCFSRRQTILLYTPGGEEHFISLETRNFKVGKTDTLL